MMGVLPSHEGGPAEQLVQSAQVEGGNWRGTALVAWVLILPLRQQVQLLHCLAHKPAAVLLPVDLKGTQGETWERRGNTLRNILVVVRSDCDSFQASAVCTVSESDSCKSLSCCCSMHQFAMLYKTVAWTEQICCALPLVNSICLQCYSVDRDSTAGIKCASLLCTGSKEALAVTFIHTSPG